MARHLQTKTIPWRDDPGIPGFREKLLRYDEASESVVRLWYLPPGWGEDLFQGQPERHYHTTVVERGFHLFGDFPHWEFASVDDLEGDLKVFEKGLFMDRPVLSLHGILPRPVSQTGAMILYWNTGPGVSIQDEKFDTETVVVPFDPEFVPPIKEFTSCRFLQSDLLAWQPHPGIRGWKIKQLAESRGGDGRVAIVHVPTDWVPDEPIALTGTGQREWLFVLSGDLSLVIAGEADPLELAEWDYLDWEAPTSPVFPVTSASESGCVALYVGEGAMAG